MRQNRHFRKLTDFPALLAGGMIARTEDRVLIVLTRTLLRLKPADVCAVPCAVNVAAITSSAKLHLHGAALAVVEPIGFFAHGAHAPHRGLDSTCVRGA
jgi:hypothetical protein